MGAAAYRAGWVLPLAELPFEGQVTVIERARHPMMDQAETPAMVGDRVRVQAWRSPHSRAPHVGRVYLSNPDGRTSKDRWTAPGMATNAS